MILYKKVNCVCGQSYEVHMRFPVDCLRYDPAGHNPELENVLCPKCRLLRLEKLDDRTYICIACQYVMLDYQVLRMVG